MLMSPDGGGVHEQFACFGKGSDLKFLPKPLPDTTLLPTSKPHIDRVPIAQFSRKISPRASGPIQVEYRFEKLSVPHQRGGSSTRVLGLAKGAFELSPNFVCDHASRMIDRHPQLKSHFKSVVHL